MADVPVADRPRERLGRVGAQALADAELIALVIGAGTRARGALAVADDVMAAAGGEVHGLATIGADALKRITGVGGSRAARLLAALELGRRTLAPSAVRPQMRSPEDAARYLAPRYAAFPEERFGVMLLDARHRVLRTTIISTGTADASFVHPRDVFRVAALASAASVVAFHNHPSGDPTPSRDDRDVTARLERAGGIMGIDLVDHIILGHGRYFSFREESRK
jgi:DNA repair protein RadC